MDYRPNSAARSYQTSFAATLALYSCPLARTTLLATLSSGDTPQRPDLRIGLPLHQHGARRESIWDTVAGTYDKNIRVHLQIRLKYKKTHYLSF